ncbi:MAG: hypothetical protein M1835_007511 [Candelina submexicana]|nr:MAG: hypothetical protein M1835_007511 [Candelina submexicana]
MPPSSDVKPSENDRASKNNHLNNSQAHQVGLSTSRTRGRVRTRQDVGREDDGASSATRIFPREITRSPSFTLPPTSPIIPPSDDPVPSSLLSALNFGPASAANAATFHTGEWTKSLPYFGTSNANLAPSNGVNGNVSPPSIPAFRGERGVGFSHTPVSNSPPGLSSRPMSHADGYSTFSPQSQQSPSQNRRTSMYSQYPQHHSYDSQPPLPHQTQAHFYGAPDAGFGLMNATSGGFLPGANGYFCGFDTLATSGDLASQPVGNVMLVGFEGGIDIYKVERDKLDVIGHLEGLRGAVLGAKVIPSTARYDPFGPMRPLVALLVHGPMVPSAHQANQRPPSGLSNPPVELVKDLQPPDAPVGTSSHIRGHSPEDITHYQSTIEIYSLKAKERLATLFASPPVAISSPVTSPLFSPPPPVGNLRIEADGKYIVVASGTSGEVFIFGLRPADNAGSAGFRCLGKTWTTVQLSRGGSTSSSSSSTGAESQKADTGLWSSQPGSPLVSIGHRWLSVVPPTPSSLSSLNGTIQVPNSRVRVPGLDTHTSPSQPSINCDVDIPEGDGLFNWMAREMTQEFIKGARWVGDQGKQAWQNYWNKTPAVGRQAGTGGTSQIRDPAYHQPQQPPLYFPPTHSYANHSPQTSNEPVLISILDLEKMAEGQDKPSNLLIPIATFQAPIGCSYVSFAPSGLVLLTASLKGDVQFVWDLMRMAHSKVGLATASERSQNVTKGVVTRGPHVRQMARFTRMTVANIVDVVWTSPRGERLAIVTEKGTVHVFDIPPSAFQWPQPRRILRSASVPSSHGIERAGTVSGETPEKRGNMVAAAVGIVNGKTQPILAAVRARRPSIGASLSNFSGLGLTSAAGAKGGRAVAAGFSKSLSAATGTVKSLRNASEYRLHIPGSVDRISRSCVAWLDGKDGGHIALLGGGVLRVHDVRRSKTAKGHDRHSFPILGAKTLEFALPQIPGSSLSTAVLTNEHDKVSGYWALRKPAEVATRMTRGTPHPLSYAEIETNPPYQPFHTDRRINLFVYQSNQEEDSSGSTRDIHHVHDSAPWAFGEYIPTRKLHINPLALEDESGNDGVDGGMITTTQNLLKLRDGDEEVEQVVVTTRRRRGRLGAEEEGFFEDDCEVLDFAEDRV